MGRRGLPRFRPRPEDWIAASGLICLLLGSTLPALRVESFWVLERSASIFSAGYALLGGADWPLGVLVLLFSVVLPPLKLAIARYASRERARRWLGALGHWSMLDVFVVAGTVAVIRMSVVAEASPGPAIPWFTAGLLATAWLAHRRQLPARHNGARYGVLALALLLLGLFLPLLAVDRLLVFEHAPSLAHALLLLADGGGWFMVLLVALLVLGAPLLIAAGRLGMTVPPRILAVATRWDMLPVFAVAILLLGAKLVLGGNGYPGTGAFCLLAAAIAGRWPGRKH